MNEKKIYIQQGEMVFRVYKKKIKTNLKVIQKKKNIFEFQQPELQYFLEAVTICPLTMVIIFSSHLFQLVCKYSNNICLQVCVWFASTLTPTKSNSNL
jgi:hypothetical protein